MTNTPFNLYDLTVLQVTYEPPLAVLTNPVTGYKTSHAEGESWCLIQWLLDNHNERLVAYFKTLPELPTGVRIEGGKAFINYSLFFNTPIMLMDDMGFHSRVITHQTGAVILVQETPPTPELVKNLLAPYYAKANDDEDNGGYYWATLGMGTIEMVLHADDIEVICTAGVNDAAVAEALEKDYIKWQMSLITDETLMEEVKDYSGSPENTGSREALEAYALWVLAWDVKESEDYPED